ncbi:MlaE family ABC transporter permease [Nocardia sp. NPDC058480]|uniref:MlaE family ABC transporter permease n=1 Tax=unclassified Nocardia TaxID=2637762 RepID=UPI0036485638
MAFIVRSKFPRTVRRFDRMSKSMDSLGDQAIFFIKALGSVPRALVHYRTETIRLIAEISMGSGALAVLGGTVVIVGFLTFMSGSVIAVQGFNSLGDIGIEALTGFFAALINVRIAAPVISGIGLAATIGAGATAQLGAMRVAEEIDALESMAIRPIPFLVGTRVLAGMIAIVPLYALAVIASFIASRLTTVVIFGQSAGVYDHYFSTFLIPSDILWSFGQAIVMAIAVMLIHTYYGFHASGGPVGVGIAVGNAVRSSLIAVVTVTLLISLAIYGTSGNFHLSG